jgi:CRP-like cAMP-binding protein
VSIVSTYQRLSPHLEEISLTSGQVVHQSCETITEVYFPQSAIFSSIIVMSDESTTEICSVSNEGMVGLAAILGNNSLTTNSVVQISGTALKLSADVIRKEFQKGEELQLQLLLYTQAYLAHISQIAACSSLHNIEQRLARLLLLIHDCLQQDTLPLTQKYISLMLKVRRASITDIAISFQSQKIIQYSRGKIIILNRFKLEAIACECYSKIKCEYERLPKSKLISKIKY